MKEHINKAVNTADQLAVAGFSYLLLTLISAIVLVINGFSQPFGGPNWVLIGAAVGVAVSGWVVQAFASAVAAHIELAAAKIHGEVVPSTPPAR